MIQTRYFTFGLLCITAVVSCICLHLLTELSQLDGARRRLERAVTKLQEENLLSSVSRHLSASEDQEQSDLDDDDMVVVYNRVPKTGSTTLAGILYSLCEVNKVNIIHIDMVYSTKTVPLSDQMRFMHNITSWREKMPALYHGHMAFIDHSKFGVKRKPLYINMIRDPLDRLVSFYYFIRNGDDMRQKEVRSDLTHETFDECVENDGEGCDPVKLWLQIPYFCGHVAECKIPGSEWALNKAKQNVLQHYLLVGITEEMEDFVAVLEVVLPRFFRGSLAFFKSGSNSHLRKTAQKFPPKETTINKIHESPIWQMENDFYEFVRDHFHYISDQVFETDEFGQRRKKGHRFQYEKIRPS